MNTNDKTPDRHIMITFFDSKATEFINLQRIVHLPDIKSCIPKTFKNQETPIVAYKYTQPIRNTIFNYADTIKQYRSSSILQQPQQPQQPHQQQQQQQQQQQPQQPQQPQLPPVPLIPLTPPPTTNTTESTKRTTYTKIPEDAEYYFDDTLGTNFSWRRIPFEEWDGGIIPYYYLNGDGKRYRKNEAKELEIYTSKCLSIGSIPTPTSTPTPTPTLL
jgi:hypothetical protein